MRNFVLSMGTAIAALTLVTPAHAQTATLAPQDSVRLQLARDVLAASGGAQAMEVQMRAMFEGVAKLTASAMGNADPKASALGESLLRYVADEEVKAIPQLIDQTAAIYADNLTERELRDLLAWNVSPSAQAIHAKMPVILQQTMAAQGPQMKKMMSGAMTTIIDRVCAEEKCTGDERRMITAAAHKALPAS
jgi:hypothetical protein